MTRRYPGRLSAALTDLDPVDAALLEFHVIARPGFHTFCTFLAATARAPAWPPLQPPPFDKLLAAGAGGASRISSSSSGGGGDGIGPQKCGWLDAEGREITDLVAAEAADKLRSYMIISPFFGLPAGEYASLLLQHMRYHDVLGVRRYLVYVEAGASALAAEPRVQVRGGGRGRGWGEGWRGGLSGRQRGKVAAKGSVEGVESLCASEQRGVTDGQTSGRPGLQLALSLR